LYQLASIKMCMKMKEKERKKFTWFSFENNTQWIIHETQEQRLICANSICIQNVQVWYDHNNLRQKANIYAWFFTIIQNNFIRSGVMCKTCKCRFQKLSFMKYDETRRIIFVIILVVPYSAVCKNEFVMPSRANRANTP